ncbi:hypothetical protein V8F33_001755 [Rhypophila sp. PSN 637]
MSLRIIALGSTFFNLIDRQSSVSALESTRIRHPVSAQAKQGGFLAMSLTAVGVEAPLGAELTADRPSLSWAGVDVGGETMSKKGTPSASLAAAPHGAYRKDGSVTSRPDGAEDSLSLPQKRPTTSAGEVTPTPDAAGNTNLSGLIGGTTKPNKPAAPDQALPIQPTPLLPLAPRDLNAGSTQRNTTLESDDVLKSTSAAQQKLGSHFAPSQTLRKKVSARRRTEPAQFRHQGTRARSGTWTPATAAEASRDQE